LEGLKPKRGGFGTLGDFQVLDYPWLAKGYIKRLNSLESFGNFKVNPYKVTWNTGSLFNGNEENPSKVFLKAPMVLQKGTFIPNSYS